MVLFCELKCVIFFKNSLILQKTFGAHALISFGRPLLCTPRTRILKYYETTRADIISFHDSLIY